MKKQQFFLEKNLLIKIKLEMKKKNFWLTTIKILIYQNYLSEALLMYLF